MNIHIKEKKATFTNDLLFLRILEFYVEIRLSCRFDKQENILSLPIFHIPPGQNLVGEKLFDKCL